MKKNSYLWKVMHLEASLPPCAQLMNARIVEVKSQPVQLRIEYDGKISFTNPYGTIQGGFLTAMLDDTMGLTVASMLDEDEIAPTISLNVQFHTPAREGVLETIGKIEKMGGSICHVSAEIYQNGTLIASSTSSAAIQRKKR